MVKKTAKKTTRKTAKKKTETKAADSTEQTVKDNAVEAIVSDILSATGDKPAAAAETVDSGPKAMKKNATPQSKENRCDKNRRKNGCRRARIGERREIGRSAKIRHGGWKSGQDSRGCPGGE